MCREGRACVGPGPHLSLGAKLGYSWLPSWLPLHCFLGLRPGPPLGRHLASLPGSGCVVGPLLCGWQLSAHLHHRAVKSYRVPSSTPWVPDTVLPVPTLQHEPRFPGSQGRSQTAQSPPPSPDSANTANRQCSTAIAASWQNQQLPQESELRTSEPREGHKNPASGSLRAQWKESGCCHPRFPACLQAALSTPGPGQTQEALGLLASSSGPALPWCFPSGEHAKEPTVGPQRGSRWPGGARVVRLHGGTLRLKGQMTSHTTGRDLRTLSK